MPEPVHNHGTEDGPGLACGEVLLPDGQLRGACLLTDGDRIWMQADRAWMEHSIGFVWDSEEHRYGEYRAFLSGFEAGRCA